MSEEKRICPICMREFIPKKKWSLCCGADCTYERSVITQRWKRKYNKKHGLAKPKKKPKKKVLSLANINEKARNAGLDYGNYVARAEYGAK